MMLSLAAVQLIEVVVHSRAAGQCCCFSAVQLINVRAKAMQAASDEVSSGMMTVFLRADSRLGDATAAARMYMRERLGIEDPVCHVANYLFTNCKVIAGHTEVSPFEGLF